MPTRYHPGWDKFNDALEERHGKREEKKEHKPKGYQKKIVAEGLGGDPGPKLKVVIGDNAEHPNLRFIVDEHGQPVIEGD